MKSALLRISAVFAVALGTAASVPALAQHHVGHAAMVYVSKAGAADLYEVRASQIAVTRARRPQVREFAQMLVTDHTRSTQMVADAAHSDGLTPRPPMLEPSQRMMLRQLERARDRDFDRLYLSQQIPAHVQGLALHRAYARRGEGAALRRTAGEIVPVVEHHLARARELARMR
jgi:putative membrane protein